MSFLYRTDKKKMDRLFFYADQDEYDLDDDTLEDAEVRRVGQFEWHRWYDLAFDEKVTPAHFGTYMKNSFRFNAQDSILFDCYRSGVLDDEIRETRTTETIENEDFVHDIERIERKYVYKINVNHPNAEQKLTELAMSMLDEDAYYTSDLVNQTIEKVKKEFGGKIANLDNAYFHAKTDLEIAIRNGLDPDYEKANLEAAVSSVNYVEQHPEGEEETEQAETEKEEIGNKLLQGMRGTYYAHRNHSVFFAIFHPIKYYRESKAISDAKQALVKLGADEKDVARFHKDMVDQDRYLRDKQNFHRAKILGEFMDVDFSTMKKVGGYAENARKVEEREMRRDDPELQEEEPELQEEKPELQQNAPKQEVPVQGEPEREVPAQNDLSNLANDTQDKVVDDGDLAVGDGNGQKVVEDPQNVK